MHLGSIFVLAFSLLFSYYSIVFELTFINNFILSFLALSKTSELAMSSSISACSNCLIWAVVSIDSLMSRLNSIKVCLQLWPFCIELVLDSTLSLPFFRCDIWFASFQVCPSVIGRSLSNLEIGIHCLCIFKHNPEWSSLSFQYFSVFTVISHSLSELFSEAKALFNLISIIF